jgi:hypothetical protein
MYMDPCIIVQFIKKNPTSCNNYQNFIIAYLYDTQRVSGNTPPIIRSLKLHWQPLVFRTWKVVGHVFGGCCQAQCAWQHPPTTHPTTFHVWRTRGCQCSFRLLMMGGVLPETHWASYKYGIIKCWYTVASCWIYELKQLVQGTNWNKTKCSRWHTKYRTLKYFMQHNILILCDYFQLKQQQP